MEAAGFVNLFYDTSKPVELAKRATTDESKRASASPGVFGRGGGVPDTDHFISLRSPTAAEAFAFLNSAASAWRDVHEPRIIVRQVSPTSTSMSRVEEKQLDELFGLLPDAPRACKGGKPPNRNPHRKALPATTPLRKPLRGRRPTATSFRLMTSPKSICVSRNRQRRHVEGSDKLLRLTLDVGEKSAIPGQSETATSSRASESAYAPDADRPATVLVANLAPRKMKFIAGMVLAASAKMTTMTQACICLTLRWRRPVKVT